MHRRHLPAAAMASLMVIAVVVIVTGSLARTGPGDNSASKFEIPEVAEDAPGPSPTPSPTPTPTPTEPQLDVTAEVSVEIDGFLHWAALDRRTGDLVTSEAKDATSTTESMIKVWLVADHLRRLADAGKEPSDDVLARASRAIRASDDLAAQDLYRDGGGNAVVERMIDICELTDTEIYPGWWSRTEISARDAVRLGECVADGRAAGPEWTDWLLEEMRRVRGSTDPDEQPNGGRWGIIDGLPEQVLDQGVSIKNGWTPIGRTGNWHIACLAIHADWVIAVIMQYPADRPLDYGVERCASVAEQLVPWGAAEVG